MSRWDERDVPPLEGRVAVVTGSNSGLGLEVALVLARRGAKVVLACRNREKAEAAAGRVSAAGTGGAEVVTLDLASLASVGRAAQEILDGQDRIDMLINNAGLMAIDHTLTEDGFEAQMGVNHLGHFAFTALLAPLLLATPAARIVNVSSIGHRGGVLNLDDLLFERRRYDRGRPYFQSKLANLLFTFELDRRLRAAGRDALAVAAHPGASSTDLGHEGTGWTNSILRVAGGFGQPAWLGALPIVRAAVDPHVQGGQFYGPRFLLAGYPVREAPAGRARNATKAARLWERSEDLTRVKFTIPHI